MGDDKKPKPKVPDKADNKMQSERFIETAREHDADISRRKFEDAFKNMSKSRPTKRNSD